MISIPKLQTTALVLYAHLLGAARGEAKLISNREYFYVGGEYTNITASYVQRLV